MADFTGPTDIIPDITDIIIACAGASCGTYTEITMAVITGAEIGIETETTGVDAVATGMVMGTATGQDRVMAI